MKNVEAPVKKPRCQFISKIGARCPADPQTGKAYCFFHDPDQKKKQAEARKQGGEARSRQIETEVKLPPNLPAVRLETAGNVVDLMEETVHHLQCGKMDIRAAKTLAYLSSLLLRALKAGQRRIAALLSDTINQVRRGETDLPTAKTIGHLTSIMLTALKQEAQEGQAATEAQRHDSIEAVITPMVAPKLPEDQELHPAVINGMGAVNIAGHPEARHA